MGTPLRLSKKSEVMDTTILGIKFFKGSTKQALLKIIEGGLLVAPSGPGMANDLIRCDEYARALTNADVVLLDSGFISLWSKIFFKEKITRNSGLKFLQYFLSAKKLDLSNSLWIMPDSYQSECNRKWLSEAYGIELSRDRLYIAPQYPKKGKIGDPNLLKLFLDLKPEHVLIQLGGGVQERLGLYLRERANFKTSIFCTGAAIAFLSGLQNTIPRWADRIYMGWFLRCFYEPRLFIPRYFKALRLIFLLSKYGKVAPMNYDKQTCG